MKIKNDDLDRWPDSWAGFAEDVPFGKGLVEVFRPFIAEMSAEGLSPRTINGHIDNLWVLGGEIIRDINQHDEARKTSPLQAILNEIDCDEGPMVRDFSEYEQDKLDATCRKLHRHIEKLYPKLSDSE